MYSKIETWWTLWFNQQNELEWTKPDKTKNDVVLYQVGSCLSDKMHISSKLGLVDLNRQIETYCTWNILEIMQPPQKKTKHANLTYQNGWMSRTWQLTIHSIGQLHWRRMPSGHLTWPSTTGRIVQCHLSDMKITIDCPRYPKTWSIVANPQQKIIRCWFMFMLFSCYKKNIAKQLKDETTYISSWGMKTIRDSYDYEILRTSKNHLTPCVPRSQRIHFHIHERSGSYGSPRALATSPLLYYRAHHWIAWDTCICLFAKG